MGHSFRAGVCLGLALCFTLGVCASVNNVAAQADGLSAGTTTAPRAPLERVPAAALDRVSYAVEGAESDHGTDPLMWGPNPKGPQGPMQVSADAAEDVGGGNRFDARENRALGRAYLAQMYRRYGSWPEAVAAYNWGPGNMDAWISGGRPFDKFPLAVERYRIRVLVGSSLGVPRLRFVRLQPRRPAPDPHNGRAGVARLYTEIMRASEAVAR
jgi:transglycosylase-like protein with SLT domain